MAREDDDRRHAWHVAVNQYVHPLNGITRSEDCGFMYAAKDAADEVLRIQSLFKAEREGTLPLVHQQCSRSPEVPLEKNGLGCCLGVRTEVCPYLLALDQIKGTDDDRDRAKAWTCATHILMSGGDPAGEGFILTDEDVLYWQTLYANMAAAEE